PALLGFMAHDDDGSVSGCARYDRWQRDRDGAVAMVKPADRPGLVYIRRGDAVTCVHLTLEALVACRYRDWTPITDDLEVRMPLAAPAGSIYMRARVD